MAAAALACPPRRAYPEDDEVVEFAEDGATATATAADDDDISWNCRVDCSKADDIVNVVWGVWIASVVAVGVAVVAEAISGGGDMGRTTATCPSSTDFIVVLLSVPDTNGGGGGDKTVVMECNVAAAVVVAVVVVVDVVICCGCSGGC